MTSECKLCALLGATTLIPISKKAENGKTHAELHSRQSDLINLLQDPLDKNREVPVESGAPNTINGQFPTEELKKEALFIYCRELVVQGKISGITCSQCNHSILVRSRIGIARTAGYIINHACVHLNKHLFMCRQCDLKFISKGGVSSHLQRFHTLSNNSANYIDMMEGHQNEIMDMVKLCFGEEPKKCLNVTAFGKQKKNKPNWTPFSKVAHSFLVKYERGDRIQCQLCPTTIPNTEQAGSKIVDHARWHLDKPMFTCRICPYFASTTYSVRQHLKTIHSVAASKQNFKDESSEYFEEISSMMNDCFGDMKKERQPVISKEDKIARQVQSTIRSRYGNKSLLVERQLRCRELAQRFQQSGKLQCRICHLHLVVVKAGNPSYLATPMGHALAHFNKVLFTCRRCSYNSSSKNAMGIHVRSKHGIPQKNEFDDRTDDFHSDFMDLLSKCYDWNLEPERPEGSISGPIVIRKDNSCRIIHKMRGNDLKASRHIRASELIQSHSKDGKIICRVCFHSASISYGSNNVFKHAMKHLDKRYWPYHCKLCSYVCVNRSNIRKQHLRKVHKYDTDGEGFEDLSDKVHLEIMNILSECYDWSVEPGEI